jgi:hypothetical protein
MSWHERYGVSKEEHKRLVAAGITERWHRLRMNCKKRAIPFDLSVSDYEAAYGDKPHGKCKGCYVLSIRDRKAGYVVGNLLLRTVEDNTRATRARDEHVPRTAVSHGVYLIHPGSALPYTARVGKSKSLGYFKTASEAFNAREKALLEAA